MNSGLGFWDSENVVVAASFKKKSVMNKAKAESTIVYLSRIIDSKKIVNKKTDSDISAQNFLKHIHPSFKKMKYINRD